MERPVEKVTFQEIDDGREDVILAINGKALIVFPEEGYKSVGMSYKAAKIVMGLIVITLKDFDLLPDGDLGLPT